MRRSVVLGMGAAVAAVLGASAAVVPFVVGGHGASASGRRVVLASAAVRAEGGSKTASQRIPAAAAASISRYLGESEAGYWARPASDGWSVSRHLGVFSVGYSSAGAQLSGAHGQRLTFDAPSSRAVTRVARNRVTYRSGNVSEWFADGPAGLEQGFDVRSPGAAPDGGRTSVSSGAITLPVRVSGTLHPVRRDGQIEFLTGSGKPALRYGQVTATDASGRALKASLAVSRGQVQIHVDTRGVRYPLLVDPTVTTVNSSATLQDAADAQTLGSDLGASVAVDGSTVVVGEPQETATGINDEEYAGQVDVFVEPAGGWTGTLTPTVVLENPNSDGSASFGHAVAITGAAPNQTIVVGATDNNQSGNAYVYDEPSGGWAGAAADTPQTLSGSQDDFGSAVAADGNTIVVGDGQTGELSIYALDGVEWEPISTVSLTGASYEDATIGDSLAVAEQPSGSSVIVAGDTYYNDAYLFVEPVDGWPGSFATPGTITSPSVVLATPDGFTPDDEQQVYVSVGIDPAATEVIVGLPESQQDENYDLGSAYVYVEPSAGWLSSSTYAPSATLSPDLSDLGQDPNEYDLRPGQFIQFGDGVAISGAAAIVSEQGFQSDENGGYLTDAADMEGADLEFQEPSGGWGAVTSSPATAGAETPLDPSDLLAATGSYPNTTLDPNTEAGTGSGQIDYLGGETGTDAPETFQNPVAYDATAGTILGGAADINPGCATVHIYVRTIDPSVAEEGCNSDENSYNTPAGGAFVWAVTPQARTTTTTTATTTTVTTTTAATISPTAKGTVSATVVPAQTPVCSKPTGSIHGIVVGPVHLGMTAAAVSHVFLRHNQTYYGTQRFCVIGGDERVEFPTRKLLAQLGVSIKKSVTDRVVLELTANPHYVLHGVRHGTSVADAVRELKLGAGIKIGLNTWYLSDAGPDDVLVKTEGGVVQEIGYLDSQLIGGLRSHLSGHGGQLEQFFATFLNSGIHL